MEVNGRHYWSDEGAMKRFDPTRRPVLGVTSAVGYRLLSDKNTFGRTECLQFLGEDAPALTEVITAIITADRTMQQEETAQVAAGFSNLARVFEAAAAELAPKVAPPLAIADSRSLI